MAAASPVALDAAWLARLVQHAAHKIVPMGFVSASMVAESRGEMITITTGVKEVDAILEGMAMRPAD